MAQSSLLSSKAPIHWRHRQIASRRGRCVRGWLGCTCMRHAPRQAVSLECRASRAATCPPCQHLGRGDTIRDERALERRRGEKHLRRITGLKFQTHWSRPRPAYQLQASRGSYLRKNRKKISPDHLPVLFQDSRTPGAGRDVSFIGISSCYQI